MKSTAGEKLKLPENRKPSVLDRFTVWNAIKPPDYIDDDADKEYLIKTTATLRLEFRQILKIDNLQDLTSLTRLFLDNNFIEKVTGLEFLSNLVWLDLSFNKIQKIDGLSSQKNLQVLALYQNEIKDLENLEHMEKLSVLRIGNNRLNSRDDILYLRKLRSLRTLSIKGNPLCTTEDWKSFTISLLPHLSFLEIHPISAEERDKAALRYQGDILRAEGKEEQEGINLEKTRLRLAAEKRHRDAFVDTVKGDILLGNLQWKNAREENKIVDMIIKNSSGGTSLKEQFEFDIAALGEKIHMLGLDELNIREKEVKLFEDSIETAQNETQQKGVKTIESFLREKENIFNKLYDLQIEFEEREQDVTELQREEVEKLRELFRTRTKMTWNVVMTQEITLVSQTEQVLRLFETSLYGLIDSFLSEVRALFQHGRNIDIRYFKSLSEIGEKMETFNYETISSVDQKLDTESDSLLSLTAKCHDGHQGLLLQEEEKLHDSVHEWASEYLSSFRQKERERNRTRVLELNFFLDSNKQEVDDLEIIPQLTVDEDDL